MNKVKLFGKVQHISDIKFDITRKQKAYITIQIITTSEDIFNCIAYEKTCDRLCNINEGDYVYICGSVFCYYNYCNVVVDEIYTLAK